jgi:hypothetical protein
MAIDHARFVRVLARAQQLGGRPTVKPIVKTVWAQKLEPAASRYFGAHRRLQDIEKKRDKERGEGLASLVLIQQPYEEARTAMRNFVTDVALPKSLGSLRTATDKRMAIARMLEIVGERRATEQWAADIAEGPFGTLAPAAIREIDEWIEADEEHEEAVRDRAAAYEEAYKLFLGFRQQVAASYGESSIHYRRLVVRSTGKLEIDDIDDVEEDTELEDDAHSATDAAGSDGSAPNES